VPHACVDRFDSVLCVLQPNALSLAVELDGFHLSPGSKLGLDVFIADVRDHLPRLICAGWLTSAAVFDALAGEEKQRADDDGGQIPMHAGVPPSMTAFRPCQP
jgi:hypothetical protein